TVLTPNQKEAAEASGIPIQDGESARDAAKVLQKIVGGDAIVITRGPAGVSVFPRRRQPRHIPAQAREAFDVTGAGDTFISAFGLTVFAGESWADAARLGNAAGSIAVAYTGVATVTAEELTAALELDPSSTRRKIVGPDQLEQICRSLRQNGSRVVFTNGF